MPHADLLQAGRMALWRRWSWPQLITELHSPERGQGYLRRLGFDPHDISFASAFRMALNETLETWLIQCTDSLVLGLMAYGYIPTRATFPGDPPERGVSIAVDSPLIAARSRMRCRYQNGTCFRPRRQRTCAARQAGQDICGSDTDACTDHCRLATGRDPEVAYVSSSGSNQPPGRANPAPDNGRAQASRRGKHHFAYQAAAFDVVDDRVFTYWSIPGPPVAADRNDHLPTLPGFQDLRRRFPKLKTGEVTADAGEGYDEILSFIYDDLKALRLIDLRQHETDAKRLTLLKRGYDAQGNAVCPHGDRLAFKGHDYDRGDSQGVCRQRCRSRPQPDIQLDPPAPGHPADCPYRTSDQPRRYLVRVRLALPDGWIRLARDLKADSRLWMLRQARRS